MRDVGFIERSTWRSCPQSNGCIWCDCGRVRCYQAETWNSSAALLEEGIWGNFLFVLLELVDTLKSLLLGNDLKQVICLKSLLWSIKSLVQKKICGFLFRFNVYIYIFRYWNSCLRCCEFDMFLSCSDRKYLKSYQVLAYILCDGIYVLIFLFAFIFYIYLYIILVRSYVIKFE